MQSFIIETPSADTGATPCSDIEDRLSPTGDNDTSGLGRSPNAPEHVSVIAGPMLTRKVASPQTEAMDLSHHKSPTENADHNSHPAVDMDDVTVCDNPVPMDLSSNTKPSVPATPPTPLTPPTSEPERIDQVPSLQAHPDEPELPVSDIPSLVEAPVLVSSSESGMNSRFYNFPGARLPSNNSVSKIVCSHFMCSQPDVPLIDSVWSFLYPGPSH